MRLLFFATFLLALANSSNPITCSSDGVFSTIAGGDDTIKMVLEGTSRVAFEAVKYGTAVERGVNMMDRVISQANQRNCEQKLIEYLGRFFVSKDEIARLLQDAFDGVKDQVIQTHLNTIASSIHVLQNAADRDNTWEYRIEKHIEYANTVSVAGYNILIMAAQTGSVRSNLDTQFIWIVKALDAMNLAFNAADWAIKALVKLPDLGVIFGENKKPGPATPQGNIYETNVWGVGGWGGTCVCPNGEKYWVGDNNDYCNSIACIGGRQEGRCQEKGGPWSGNRVTCNSSPEVNHVEQVSAAHRYSCGRWLGKYPSTAQECHNIVVDTAGCDNEYFSWANGNDNNCWCVTDRGCGLDYQYVVNSYKGTQRSAKTPDKAKIRNWLRALNTVMVQMVQFNNKLWRDIAPQLRKFKTERVHSISPAGIMAINNYKRTKWNRHCFQYIESDIECFYNSPVHTHSKGPILNTQRDTWIDQVWRDTFKRDCPGKGHNGWDYTDHGCATCAYVGTSNFMVYKAKDDLTYGETYGMTAQKYCQKNEHNQQYDDMLEFYELDDWYRLNDAFTKVYWKGRYQFRAYEQKNHHDWVHQYFQYHLDQNKYIRGLLITDVLYNGILQAGQKNGVIDYSYQPVGEKQYHEFPAEMATPSGFGLNGRRHLTEEELDEVSKLVEETSVEDLVNMEEEDPTLMDKILILGHQHGPYPTPMTGAQYAPPSDKNLHREMINGHLESDSKDYEEGSLNGVDGEESNDGVDGERTDDVANEDTDDVVNEEKDDADGIDAGVADALEEALATNLSEKSSNWNMAPIGCFFVGAALVYFYMSYKTQKNSRVTYGLITEEI